MGVTDDEFDMEVEDWVRNLPPATPWMTPSTEPQARLVGDGEPDPEIEDNNEWLQQQAQYGVLPPPLPPGDDDEPGLDEGDTLVQLGEKTVVVYD